MADVVRDAEFGDYGDSAADRGIPLTLLSRHLHGYGRRALLGRIDVAYEGDALKFIDMLDRQPEVRPLLRHLSLHVPWLDNVGEEQPERRTKVIIALLDAVAPTLRSLALDAAVSSAADLARLASG